MMENIQRFKANIRKVEVEPHSFCNRKCWFCPNKNIDRTFSPRIKFNESIYHQLIDDLAGINYNHALNFAGFCEPTAEIRLLLWMIELARKKLPTVAINVNTNTDFLSTDIVERLSKAGLSMLKCQLYFGEDEVYDARAAGMKVMQLMEKLPGVGLKEVVRGQWFGRVGGLIVTAYSKNFHEVGHDRCDIDVRKDKQKRFTVCYEPMAMVGVGYDGWVYPCCNIRTDYGPHKLSLLGQMNDSPGRIFEIYRGLLLPEDEYPCDVCTGKNLPHASARLVYNEIYDKLKAEEQWQTKLVHN